jgi:salicylate hydroxylase
VTFFRLQALIAEIPSSLKWKLQSFKPLETWVKGPVALLGDACHPTLPYQAQGAAMAVEDGACLGKLLGLAAKSKTNIPEVLQLYEGLRKDRTTLNVEGANGNRKLYHAKGKAAEERARVLKDFDWDDPDARSPYKGFNDMPYQRALLGFNTVNNAEEEFHRTFDTNIV